MAGGCRCRYLQEVRACHRVSNELPGIASLCDIPEVSAALGKYLLGDK
jgi:hypothetical protein